MVELREDILDQLNKLYFERLRVKSELDNLALEDRRKRFDKQLKLEELTASLDALTSGYYSEQLRLLAAK
jgi:ABC-type phosphate transport system auxiliary subunit